MSWLPPVLGIVTGLLLTWGLTVVALCVVARRQEDVTSLTEVLRLVPDVVRLIRGLAADPSLPRSARLSLSALLIYLVLPVDLIPDFIPVIGYADDAVILAIALRYIVRAAGPELLARHWPGTPQGLSVVRQLAHV